MQNYALALLTTAAVMGVSALEQGLLPPSSCTQLEANTANIEFDFSNRCIRGSMDDNDVTLNFTVTPAMVEGNKRVDFFLWNIDQARSPTFKVDGAQWLQAVDLTDDQGINGARVGLVEEGSTDTTTFIATYHGDLCPGDYSIQFQGVNGNYGISIFSFEQTDLIAEISNDGTDGRPSNVAAYFISGANFPTFNFKGDFTEKRYATKKLMFNTTGDLLYSGVNFQAGAAFPSLGPSSDQWRAGDMTLETVWNNIGRPSVSAQGSGFFFGIGTDTVDDVFFNWAEKGPVSSVNVSVVGHVDYPTVSWSSPSGSVVIPSDESFEIVRIGPMPTNFHRFQPDGLMQSVRMTSGTGENLGMGGDAEFTCLVDNVPTQATTQTTCTSDEIPANSPTSFSSNFILTPRERDTPAYVYYRIERTTCLTTSSASSGLTEDPALNVTFTLDYQSIEGECMDYTDCYVDGDDHPSLRTSFSSTGNTNKMIQCVGMPKRSNPDLFESRCMECTSDCHCPGGSYCHTDNGVCNDGVRNYLCDGDSHRMAGVCKVKDAAKEIIGKPCRTDQGATYSIVQSKYRHVSLPGSALIISEGAADDRSDGITGGGFCGEARYYNSSNVDFPSSNVKRSGAARAILWEGQCVSGMCQECSDGEVQCASSQTGNGGDKMCIRGRLRDTIIVDQTIRTFTSNTVAGTALSGVMMIIVVQIIFVVYFVVERGDAHRQEEEAKEEKKKEQAEQKAEKARKELAAHDGKVIAKEGGKKKGAGASESKEN